MAAVWVAVEVVVAAKAANFRYVATSLTFNRLCFVAHLFASVDRSVDRSD